ncbi:MAG: FKBP-type peptidyl-prolyl cis-trans isomerase [Elusimicrobia bacterium]|nr:FKBP-type peptidyl-prolyl cis-trans isomerase [Elusimicrobiota bacterium]
MKFTLLALSLAVSAAAADAPKAEAPKAAAAKPAAAPKPAPAPSVKDGFKSDDERGVYTIGYLMGRNIAPFNLTPAEIGIVSKGIADAAGGKPALVDIRFHQSRINDMLAKRMEGAAAKEKEKGKAYVDKFVKENKPQPIPGGGWYLETTAGTGPMPGKTDTVKVHYRGVTVDGQQFDSSYDRGTPTEFALNGVIACWTNGISMMKQGGKAKLVCPSDVAYGDPGRPGIKPGATLIFDTELVEVVAAAPAPVETKKKK